MSSQSSHHPEEVHLAQFSLYVHKYVKKSRKPGWAEVRDYETTNGRCATMTGRCETTRLRNNETAKQRKGDAKLRTGDAKERDFGHHNIQYVIKKSREPG